MKIVGIIFKIAIYVSLVLFIAFFSFAAVYLFCLSKNLPSATFGERSACCLVYDGNGNLIEDFSKRQDVEFFEIPECVKNAFIAVEDKRFYSHRGVDVRGTLRAMKNNLLKGKTSEGGSTITQQLVKNLFLSGEKTIERKAKEMILSLELEKKYSKSQILEKYLNEIYFGKGIYGVGNAAEVFFKKSISKINVNEAALLSGVVKSPRYYNPVDNPQKANERRRLVLRLLREQNYLSNKEYEELKNRDIFVDFKENYDFRPLFLSSLKSKALDILGFENEIELNGYSIYTGIDQKLSSAVSTPKDYGLNVDYSILVLDADKKKLIGLKSSVGNLSRCPASAAKPWLVYAPAINENVIAEATKILDEKTNFNGYSPSNADGKYGGYVSAKDCLARSLNVPSVKILESLGMKKALSYADKLGVSIKNKDLSIALGNIEGGMTLEKLLSCYTPFLNGGKYYDVSTIDKIKRSDGKVVYQKNLVEKRVFKESTAFIVNDMLSESVKSGSAKKLNSLPFAVYAKTGTNGNKKGNVDAYCVAYTTNRAVAVWLGNADGSLTDNTVTGGNYAAAIARDVLKNLYDGDYPTEFSPPSSVSFLPIDKKTYNEKHELALSEDCEKDTLRFYFSDDNLPAKTIKKQVLPNVKNYKITYNNGKICIFVETLDGVGFHILNERGERLFSSKESGEFEIGNLAKKEYQFFVLPFVRMGDEEILGDKIKLPKVKPFGSFDWFS